EFAAFRLGGGGDAVGRQQQRIVLDGDGPTGAGFDLVVVLPERDAARTDHDCGQKGGGTGKVICHARIMVQGGGDEKGSGAYLFVHRAEIVRTQTAPAVWSWSRLARRHLSSADAFTYRAGDQRRAFFRGEILGHTHENAFNFVAHVPISNGVARFMHACSPPRD